MTHNPNIARHAHRRAIALLLAAVALPSTAWAQETVAPPTVLVPAQSAPAPVAPPQVTPPAAQTPPGESRTTIAPGVIEQAEQEARERAAARQAEARAQAAQQRAATPAPRAAAPAAAPVPAPVTPAEPVAPVDVAPLAAPETAPETGVGLDPVPETDIAPPVIDAEPAPPAQAVAENGTMWLILAGLGALAALIAALMLLRGRREDDVVYEEYVAEPEAVVHAAPPVETARPDPDPAAAAPAFISRPVADRPAATAEGQPALENATLTTPDKEDIAAVLGGATPQGDRPHLELAMRPMCAGVNRDEAVVEFELTVANAGGAPADNVRIGAFMLTDTPGARSEIERLLVNPPADHVLDADRIAPGDGTRLDATITLPRDAVHTGGDGTHEGFTPVLVADARYRLPDGREGRTAAAFAIGRVNGGDALVPIELQDDPAMYVDIEARLHSVPAKV